MTLNNITEYAVPPSRAAWIAHIIAQAIEYTFRSANRIEVILYFQGALKRVESVPWTKVSMSQITHDFGLLPMENKKHAIQSDAYVY